MPISVSSQAYIFLWSVIGGMAIAFIYDLFRIKRKAIRTSNILIHIEDFVYWILVALVMFGVVYYSNEGEIRGYIFIGTVLGVILYTLLFSKMIIASSLFIISVVYKVVTTLWAIITYPFKLIFRILAGPARFTLKVGKGIFRGVRRTGRSHISKARIWGRRFRNIIKKI